MSLHQQQNKLEDEEAICDDLFSEWDICWLYYLLPSQIEYGQHVGPGHLYTLACIFFPMPLKFAPWICQEDILCDRCFFMNLLGFLQRERTNQSNGRLGLPV